MATSVGAYAVQETADRGCELALDIGASPRSQREAPHARLCSMMETHQTHLTVFSIDHSIVCDRVYDDFGINGPVLSWLRSFVTGRSQYIAVGSQPCLLYTSDAADE